MTNYLPAELIKKKRRGETHTDAEISYLVESFTSGNLPDYQMAAWLMAVFFRGMSSQETARLTLEMMNSGSVLDFSDCPGRKVDKHSTGGVGDKASLILAPIAAAAGVVIPMIAGRGLGHTGGTLDKLEAIPGFSVQLGLDSFIRQVRRNGLAIMGQTKDICPADRKIYALRDVTATVESLPLISASIMSKKLAEGIDGLVMDVKVGSGAFMKTIDEARALAKELQAIGRLRGKRVVALITDMNQPLGRYVGNSLEIFECESILKGECCIENGIDFYEDIRRLGLELAGHMIWLADITSNPEDGVRKAKNILESGTAFEKWTEMVEAQGGGRGREPVAPLRHEIFASKDGFVDQIDSEKVGIASIHLGAGRTQASDPISPCAGISVHVKLGQSVKAGQLLYTMFGDQRSGFAAATSLLESATIISLQKTTPPDLIRERLLRW